MIIFRERIGLILKLVFIAFLVVISQNELIGVSKVIFSYGQLEGYISKFDLEYKSSSSAMKEIIFILATVFLTILIALFFLEEDEAKLFFVFTLLVIIINYEFKGSLASIKIKELNEAQLIINKNESINKGIAYNSIIQRFSDCNASNRECIIQVKEWAIDNGYEFDFHKILSEEVKFTL